MATLALVTGASSGFGAALTRRFVAEGLRVVALARRRERLEALGAELGEALFPLALDLRERPAVEEALATLPPAWSEVDVLVNNAGLALGLEPADRASLDDWDEMIATNVRGLVVVTRTLLPGMVARGRGHIVNIGSTAASYPYPGGNVYGATKAFVAQFSLNLRADLLGTPLRVTDVAPGLVGGSEFSQVRFHGDAARAASVYAGTTPLSPEDIADGVFWVISRPPHVNVNVLELMPVCQAFGPLAVARERSASG